MSYRNNTPQLDMMRQLQKTMSSNIETVQQTLDTTSSTLDSLAIDIEMLKQKLQLIDTLSQKIDTQAQLIDTLSQKVDTQVSPQFETATLNNRLNDVEKKINTFQFPDLDSLQNYLKEHQNLEFELQYKF